LPLGESKIWEIATWENANLGNYPWEKIGKWKPCLRFGEMHHAHDAVILDYIIRTIHNFLPNFE